jgi:hypothetical protein
MGLNKPYAAVLLSPLTYRAYFKASSTFTRAEHYSPGPWLSPKVAEVHFTQPLKCWMEAFSHRTQFLQDLVPFHCRYTSLLPGATDNGGCAYTNDLHRSKLAYIERKCQQQRTDMTVIHVCTVIMITRCNVNLKDQNYPGSVPKAEIRAFDFIVCQDFIQALPLGI